MGLSCSSDFGSLWFWLFSGRQIIIQKDLKNRSGKLYDECRMEGVNPDREVEALSKEINGMVGYRTKRSTMLGSDPNVVFIGFVRSGE